MCTSIDLSIQPNELFSLTDNDDSPLSPVQNDQLNQVSPVILFIT